MLLELKDAKPDLNIELIGINLIDEASSIGIVTDISTFPWLQDTLLTNIWTLWQANKDDLFIVNSRGCLQNLYRIGLYDLTYPTNRDALKKYLLTAATLTSQDRNQVPATWGQQYFGSTTVKANEDPDGDGRDNFTEYAFGTKPNDPRSAIPIKVSVRMNGEQQEILIDFRRRAGSVLDYFIETSTDLAHWVALTPAHAKLSNPRNLFDGTGTSEMQVTLMPVASDALRWVRVRAVPRSQ